MSRSDEKKWQQRYQDATVGNANPALVLQRYAYLLPDTGTALDLAAGLGANAVFLAKHGLDTSAWDISSNAIDKLSLHTATVDLSLKSEVRDVVTDPPLPESFDVIVISHFLDRALCPAIAIALKPGGLLFYQTFLAEKADPGIGPRNPAFLLGQNELLHLFGDLIIRAYHEEGTIGDISQGIRNEALLVAQRAPL